MSESQTETTEQQAPVVFTYTGRRNRQGKPAEFLPGIPARDLSERDVARLSERQRELVEVSTLYQSAGEELRDPLGELSNEQYGQLTPAEKGARTRAANQAAKEAAGQDDGAGEGAGDDESAGEDDTD